MVEVTWVAGDYVTVDQKVIGFFPGEPLIVISVERYDYKGTIDTRPGCTVLCKKGKVKKQDGHFWVPNERIVHNPVVDQKDVDEAIQSILHATPEDVPEDDIRTRLEELASEWMRNEERNSDYQDGLADAAEQLRAVLAEKEG